MSSYVTHHSGMGICPWGRSVPTLPVGPQRDGDARQPLPSMAGCVYAQVVAGVGCRADARRETHRPREGRALNRGFQMDLTKRLRPLLLVSSKT